MADAEAATSRARRAGTMNRTSSFYLTEHRYETPIDNLANQLPAGESHSPMDVTGQLCARARFWASLRIDGELSELEGALLDAHLARCDACREVVAGFTVATEGLRAAPLVVPAPLAVASSRPRRLLVAAAVAAVVVLGVIAGGLVRGETAGNAGSVPHAVAIVASVETPDQLRRLRRTTLLNMRPIPRDMSAEPV